MKIRFNISEMVLLALLAAISIVIKPYLKLIVAALPIGGVVMGVIYMMWVVLIALLIEKKGVATIFGFLQAILALILGVAGKWGFWALLGYTLPGVAVDLIFMTKFSKFIKSILSGAAANLVGTIIATILFTPQVKNKIILIMPSIFTGAIGGFLAIYIYKFYSKIQRKSIEI